MRTCSLKPILLGGLLSLAASPLAFAQESVNPGQITAPTGQFQSSYWGPQYLTVKTSPELLDEDEIPTFEVVESDCTSATCSQDMQELVEFALNGSSDAQVIAAVAYATGDGLPADPDRARQFLKRALQQKDSRAWYIYSQWLRQGAGGFEEDRVEAEYALQRAARRGSPQALYELAVRELNFDGGDNSEAVALLERAAQRHDLPAKYLLAQLKAGGVGTPEDLVGAAKLFAELKRWNYRESSLRYDAVMADLETSQNTEAMIEVDLYAKSGYEDKVEVIEVSGARITTEEYVSELVDVLSGVNLYDGDSTGTNIRGQVCGQGVSKCNVIYTAGDRGNAGTTALGAILGKFSPSLN